jgi:hypothetical protein
LLYKLSIRSAEALLRRYKSLTVLHSLCGSAQVFEYGLTEERLVACPVDIARIIHPHNPLDIVLGSSQAEGNSFSVRVPSTVHAKVGLHK